MTFVERLRWACEPVPRRSSTLLWSGMAVFLAGAAALTKGAMPAGLSFVVYLVVVAGWIAGACGAVGYARWLFRQNEKETRKQ
jgi:hypothetical protein